MPRWICVLICTAVAASAWAQEYTFPVAANIDVMVWEAAHWDGQLAVDIGVHPGFPPTAPEREAFYSAQVVALTGGTAMRLDNPRGGTAVLLHGDDGRTYYYAHLSQAAIEEPTRVAAGEPLGQIGNTGTWSQFLEPHLHLSIANGHQNGFDWIADVDPVLWLEQEFARGPIPVPANTLAGAAGVTYPVDAPEGLPLFPGYTITADYDAVAGENPLLAGVRLAPRGFEPDAVGRAGDTAAGGASATHAPHDEQASRARPAAGRQAPVRATVAGAVRVHRDTSLGLRLQITNARARYSVLISGPIEPVVTTGDVVFADQIIGFASGELHYTIFKNGRLGGRELFPPAQAR